MVNTTPFEAWLVGHTTTSQWEYFIPIPSNSHVAIPIPVPKLHHVRSHCDGIFTGKLETEIPIPDADLQCVGCSVGDKGR